MPTSGSLCFTPTKVEKQYLGSWLHKSADRVDFIAIGHIFCHMVVGSNSANIIAIT